MHKIEDLQLDNLLGVCIQLPKTGDQILQIVTTDALNFYCLDMNSKRVGVFSKSETLKDAVIVESSSTKEALKQDVYKKQNGGFLVLSLEDLSAKWTYFVGGEFKESRHSEFELLVSMCKKALDESVKMK
jgi:hypothetical protein